uniref:ATP synthase complex subunit 8 n=1 Tax=Ips sexdentatus TaxID=55985 RepID=A0A343UJK9_9CUCU|nr:ATP synthase F0 subunit 8 [Ips sexdentatus]AOY39594.1 ATP synthase F0 subunit 8 [Ips sexdentatus]AVC55946.1 ATP synthase F0 subunit 8 [Ips sexdentatus]
MPQMAPMNWLTLFLFFSILFILTIFLNYFFHLFPSINLFNQQKKNNKLLKNWKW